MTEYLKQLYAREEQFLDEFGDCAAVASKILSGDWEPNFGCDDSTRNNQNYFLPLGQLRQLVFESAAVMYDGNNFSSVQVVLRSSKRIVTVRIARVGTELIAEKIVDRPQGN